MRCFARVLDLGCSLGPWYPSSPSWLIKCPCPMWSVASHPSDHHSPLHVTVIVSISLIPFILFYFFKFYFWLRWVFVAARGLSLVAASGDYSSLRCTGFSLQWLLLLRSML